MLTCTVQPYVQVKLHQVAKKGKKAMGGGMMDMTRMRYLKGGQV